MKYYIGCDAHKKYSVFAGIGEAGEIVPAQRVEHDRESYRSFLNGLPAASQIAVESVGNWYPLIDELIAVMGWNAYVFLDLSGFIWSYPLEEIHATIKRLVQAGFGKRIMYGTDFIFWPRMIEASIGVIENASYLTQEQKRDILYNNAARFLRIDEMQLGESR